MPPNVLATLDSPKRLHPRHNLLDTPPLISTGSISGLPAVELVETPSLISTGSISGMLDQRPARPAALSIGGGAERR
ncbi:MAG TPA: hypothetical protein VH419_03975 [Nocardioidaceae bacterium]